MPERYELIRHIANGGMASVWCAEDRVLGRRGAIKLLAERFAYDQTSVRRLKREQRRLIDEMCARQDSLWQVFGFLNPGE